MPGRVHISDTMKTEMRRAINGAAHGEKRTVAQEYAERLGVSVSTVYDRINATNGKKKCKRKPDTPDEVILKLGAMKVNPGKYGRKKRYLRTDDVIRLAEETGIIKEGQISRSSLDRRLRELGFNEKRAYNRYEDDYVNQVHMVDFSVSDYLGVTERVDGEWQVVLLGKGAANPYKNKPGDASKKKLWLCSLVDTYSRITLHQYIVSPGENLRMATDFLNYAYYREYDNLPVPALPDRLELDQGSIGKSNDFEQGMNRLDVEVVLKANKSDREAKHQSGGKVERRFRSYWQTEALYAELMRGKGISSIALSELNALAYDECVRLAQKKHPVRRRHGIKQVYEVGLKKRELLHERGQIERGNVYLHTSMYDILYKKQYRTPDASGIISIDDIYYKIEDRRFDLERIEVATNRHGERIGRYTDSSTGEIIEFGIYEYDPDTAKREKPDETLRQRLAAMDEEDYADGSFKRSASGGSQPDNVIKMPARSEKKEIETPYTKQHEEERLTFEDAQEQLCDACGITWAEVPDIIKKLMVQAYESEQLTPDALEDFRRVVNQ